MSKSMTDRNLLFGVLAFQMDFVTREQLIVAMQTWVFDKKKSIGEILTAQKVLADDSRQLLEALVQKHLAMHDNDAQKSLAAVSSVSSVKPALDKIQDDDLQASLTIVGVNKNKDADPYLTIAPTLSTMPGGGSSRFPILRPHAKGGLGEVFIAKDTELNREVALKEIQNRAADNVESRARFMIEGEITGRLEHPGIVPVYGLGKYADGRPYCAMRFIRGKSLKEAIERFHKDDQAGMDPGLRIIEEQRLLRRFIDVCNAMGYAHNRGILHRDLKPANIMLGDYGETLVIDWGLAKWLGDTGESRGGPSEPGEGSLIPSSLSAGSATMVGSAMGTPQYMSPEQAEGKINELGPATDIYSLGATLYCLLAGRPPVVDGNVGAVLQKVQRGDIPRLRDVKPAVAPALEAICMKALALNPGDRYVSPRALAADIEHWLADEPVSAWREPWSVRARRWVSRHRTLVTGVAAAVLVAFAGFVVTTILLTAANERERLAKVKAEENFQLARKAVDDYHTEVSESVLLHEPGMAPLRKKLLERAQKYYTQFRADRAGDPSVRSELGKATFRLAQITGDIDSELEAIKLHHEAVKLFGDPAGADAKADLAATYHHLGRLYRLTDQTDKSEEAYGQAMKQWEQIVAASKEDRHLAGLARTQLGLGNEYQLTRRLDEARAIYQKALDARKTLAEKNKDVSEYQRELAVSHNNLALVFKAIGKKEEAEVELRAALGIEKKLAEDAPHISQYQNDLARTYLNLGELTGEDEAFLQARKVREALVKRHPDVATFQTNLAETLTLTALAYRHHDAKKAQELAQEAVALQRRLMNKHPGVANYQGDLGYGLFALAQVHRLHDALPKAEAEYEEAIRLFDKPARELPKVKHYQAWLARSWNGLGLLHATNNEQDKANDAFRKSLTIWAALVKDYPHELEFAEGESAALLNIGNAMVASGNRKDAVPWYTQAQESVARLKGPRTDIARIALTTAYWKRGETLSWLGRPAEALADWERALELASNQQKTMFRFFRAADLARAGKHAEAVAEVEELMSIKAPRTGEYLYGFARIYALAANAADNDVAHTPDERQAMATPLAAQAFKLLTEARDKGFFEAKKTRDDLMKGNPDLHWLRGRPEFEKLLSVPKSK